MIQDGDIYQRCPLPKGGKHVQCPMQVLPMKAVCTDAASSLSFFVWTGGFPFNSATSPASSVSCRRGFSCRWSPTGDLGPLVHHGSTSPTLNETARGRCTSPFTASRKTRIRRTESKLWKYQKVAPRVRFVFVPFLFCFCLRGSPVYMLASPTPRPQKTHKQSKDRPVQHQLTFGSFRTAGARTSQCTGHGCGSNTCTQMESW